MSYKGYKNDIVIEYDKATKTVKVRWTNYEKAYLGYKGNSRYGNKQIKCGTLYSRKEAEAELMAIAKREQQKSIERGKNSNRKV